MSLIARIIAEDALAMEQLRAVRELALPDWCIAAGFVRNRVWDHLHGIVPARPPVDIDVLFYDATDLTPKRETAYEAALDRLIASIEKGGKTPVLIGLQDFKSRHEADR